LPLGVEGSVAVFFEGKKEELLAAWLVMKRGANVFPIVKGSKAAVERILKKLVPWNSFRKFALTDEKDLEKLVAERDLKAVVFASSKPKHFPKMLALFPLVFFPKKMAGEKLKLIEGVALD